MGTALSAPRAAGVPRSDARYAFFVLLLVLIFFFPGFRAGGVPVPSSLLLCVFYVAAFNPSIPPRIGPVFLFSFLYILLASTRNSLELTGGIKDFLYIGLCLESFLLTICMKDAIDATDIAYVRWIVTMLVVAETALQILEYFNPIGFDGAIHPLLQYWDTMANAGYLSPYLFSSRASGSFGSPTDAGFITYLLVRSLALLWRKRWIVYLAIIPLIFTGARTATAAFIVWELIVPLFAGGYRKLAIAALLAAGAAVVVVLVVFPDILNQIFLFSSLADNFATPTADQNQSAYTRLVGIQWALNRPLYDWIFGGMTVYQFDAFEKNVFSFDSEFILRSMQYGVIGFGSFVAMSLCSGYKKNDPDWWFGLFLVLVGSLANSLTTNVISFPFLILYNVALQRGLRPRPDAVPRLAVVQA
jgi:hypothetical protein